MITELDRVILTTDISDYDFKTGDLGTIVLVHQGSKGYEVEFVTLGRETVVVSLFAEQVRYVNSKKKY
ncbi:hypothetical protein NIES4071_37990 [Calothrix sp. NIES-4071]|nr:hypothetical protein NIES4071_37990 [Calothrix sp. NIES-4071]BAZ58116.1 hypothetical protein NIES4105_37920 [Calothrix sp. NIES-4105]